MASGFLSCIQRGVLLCNSVCSSNHSGNSGRNQQPQLSFSYCESSQNQIGLLLSPGWHRCLRGPSIPPFRLVKTCRSRVAPANPFPSPAIEFFLPTLLDRRGLHPPLRKRIGDTETVVFQIELLKHSVFFLCILLPPFFVPDLCVNLFKDFALRLP